jgi:hypothetical protein
MLQPSFNKVNSRGLLSMILALACAAAVHAEDIKMDMHPAFDGYLPQFGTIPIAVDLENSGPDAKGMLRVVGSAFYTDYPIELPQGSKKKVFTYPSVGFGDTQFILMTDRGRQLQTYTPEQKWASGQQVVLVISDSPGDLAFLRSQKDASQDKLSLQDAYVKPADAPDRPVAYNGVAVVMMGQGAERLGDEAVAALKLFAMTGGRLVFVGGASSPILSDPRWKDLLPASNFRPVNVTGSRTLEKLGGVPIPQATFMDGIPTKDATASMDGGVLVKASRQYGLGSIEYEAFNIMEKPLSKWPARRTALKAMLDTSEINAVRGFVLGFSRESVDAYSGSYVSGSPGSYRFVSRAITPINSDPFSMELPSAVRIFTILALYFVCVVPLNFLLLKKLGRSELAWFTAPVISLAFAFVLFSQARSLYSAKLSTASQGLLVGVQGESQGMFLGSSQVFIPTGGSYDLQLSGVDSIGLIDDNQGYSGNGQTLDLSPEDGGDLKVKQMRANNLTFREITYRQKVTTPDWFSVRRTGSGYEVSNDSPYSLAGGFLYVGSRRIQLPALKPGSSSKVSASGLRTSYEDHQSIAPYLSEKSLAISGELIGFRPGPQIGAEVTSRTHVMLAYFLRGSQP